MRSRPELHGPGHRVHAHRWIAFQDGVAVHSNDDAVVGSCIEVNAFGSRREPHTVPANPVVPGRPVSLVDERKIDGRDAFVDDRFGRGVDRIPIAAGEPGIGRQTEGRQPEQRQRDRSEPIPGAAAERAGAPTAPDSRERGRHQASHARSGASVVAGRMSLAGRREEVSATTCRPGASGPRTRPLRRTRQDLSVIRCKMGCLRTAPRPDRTACATRRPRVRVGRRWRRRSVR